MGGQKLGELTFGTILAFAAPGFIGFIAVSYHLPYAKTWIEAAQSSDQSVGVFLFVLVGSIVCGVVISGIRDLVVDTWICTGGRWLKPLAPPKAGYANLAASSSLTAFEASVENYYRFYQFYSNTAVAIGLLSASRALAKVPPAWPDRWWIVALTLVVILLISARRSMGRYCTAASEILSTGGSAK